jgi:hypothetical protein
VEEERLDAALFGAARVNPARRDFLLNSAIATLPPTIRRARNRAVQRNWPSSRATCPSD